MWVKIAEGVRFDRLTHQLVWIAEAYWYACQKEGIVGVITGAQDRCYPPGKAHREGRALDLRSRDLHDPWVAIETIKGLLAAHDLQAVVLYGKPDHEDHIHVHYAPTGGE